MMTEVPVYLLALLRVEDMEGFQAGYAGPLQQINKKHGVETLVATTQLATFEGETAENVAAILKFPSQASLDAWYADPEYQPLIKARQLTTDTGVSRLMSLTPMRPT